MQARPLRPAPKHVGRRFIAILAPVFLVAGAVLGMFVHLPGGSSGSADTLGVAPQPTVAAAAAVARPTASGATSAPDATAVALQRGWQGADGITYDPVLAGLLDTAFSAVDGNIGVVVKDLGTGRGVTLDGDAEMPSASLFKLPVLYSVFDAGVPFDDQLLITDAIKAYDLGTLELGPGETLTVAEALERMVTVSDNASAILLADRVGGAQVNNDLANLGLKSTHYGADRLTTSAADMTALLELMARGQAVSPAASADMIHLMLRQRVNDRLPKLLPDEAQVAHKTGNLDGIVNDVGIVYGPHSTFIVSALVSDTRDEAAAADGIARAAQAAYTYFEAQPEVAQRPAVPPAPDRPIPPIYREPHPPTPTTAPVVAPQVGTASRAQPTLAAAATATLASGASSANASPTASGLAAGGTPSAMSIAPTGALATPTRAAPTSVAAPTSARAAATAPPAPTAPPAQTQSQVQTGPVVTATPTAAHAAAPAAPTATPAKPAPTPQPTAKPH
ncbi:MAG: serine hydrolase [Chloroflexi bacterium]|nr:serine hydrolase [Chloroflexota bacterium]